MLIESNQTFLKCDDAYVAIFQVSLLNDILVEYYSFE
jgi:hypothetical protein